MEENKNVQPEAISEEQLENVAGGASKNRYDPQKCRGLTRIRKGFCNVTLCWCDHYRRKHDGLTRKHDKYIHQCAMLAFPEYVGDSEGNPL